MKRNKIENNFRIIKCGVIYSFDKTIDKNQLKK